MQRTKKIQPLNDGSLESYDFRQVEKRWREAWQNSRCFKYSERGPGQRFFNYDGGPFPNGQLHLGHVRNYVLGDLTARYQRLLGKRVLYTMEWDSFGLPNELAALDAGISPHQFTQNCIAEMRSQLVELGISYDWDHVTDTSNPSYYRWTQWLFLEMLDAGLIERCESPIDWCSSCQSVLARIQVIDGKCWRCQDQVENRSVKQWSVKLSEFSSELLSTIDRLEHWGAHAKKLLRNFIVQAKSGTPQIRDWTISRQRAWGAPIPVLYCDRCGVIPAPRKDLPIVPPADLDWHHGPRAISRCVEFVETQCPSCEGEARRETDTLDCYFDDIWCCVAGAVDLHEDFRFSSEDLTGLLPVDHYHGGYDTIFYLVLYQFLGLFLHQRGIVDQPEIIRRFDGHDMVLADGSKMSKHLGNTVSAGPLLKKYGADALRVAVFWAANPNRPVNFDLSLIEKSSRLLNRIFHVCRQSAGNLFISDTDLFSNKASRAVTNLQKETSRTIKVMSKLIEGYRPCAALEVLSRLISRIEAYASSRLGAGQLTENDAKSLANVLREVLIVLSIFAPHLAEECWSMIGGDGLVANANWPEV